MRFLLSLCATVALSAFCFADDKNPPSPGPSNPCLIRPGTGVEGTVERGPVQPVGKPGQKNTAPVAGETVKVLDSKGKVVASTKTDKNGYYELKLQPGKYTLVGPRSGIPPQAFKKDIEIKQGWNRVNIDLDTGIRTPVLPPRKVFGGPAKVLTTTLDLSKLPTNLTLKAGQQVEFTDKPGSAVFVKWSSVANENVNVPLFSQLKIRIQPPILHVDRAGKGELTITTKPSPKGPERSHTIKVTVTQ